MSSAGYIYVLINPSMPGLVKVGRTQRDPADRVGELSGTTGVPTPFILVYNGYFIDCTRAEEFVHTLLEKNGYRVASNREFFNAPIQEVIDAILKSKKTLESNGPELSFDENSDGECEPGDDVARDLFEKAYRHYNGSGDTLQDYKKALSLYKQAAQLGSDVACRELGDMYQYGTGCVQDDEKALEYYEEGARRGDDLSLLKMAEMFFRQKHFDNAQKCWGRFFESGHFSVLTPAVEGLRYLHAVTSRRLPVNHLSVLLRIKNEILEFAISELEHHDWLARCGRKIPGETRSLYEAQLRAVRDYLFSGASKNHSVIKQIDKLLQQGEPETDPYEQAGYNHWLGDYKNALKRYEQAANLGSLKALEKIGDMYRKGEGGVRDTKKAIEYYSRAATSGSVEALEELRSMYWGGYGEVRDLKKAFEQAERAGSVKALEIFGDMYREGRRCRKNLKRALQYYERAAGLGSADALESMACIYRGVRNPSLHALLVPMRISRRVTDSLKDLKKAIECYEGAAERGNHECYLEMAEVYLCEKQFQQAQEAWGKFFQSSSFQQNDDSLLFKRSHYVVAYLEAIAEHQLPIEHLVTLRGIKSEILQDASETLRENAGSERRGDYERQVQLIRDTLFRTSESESLPS